MQISRANLIYANDYIDGIFQDMKHKYICTNGLRVNQYDYYTAANKWMDLFNESMSQPDSVYIQIYLSKINSVHDVFPIPDEEYLIKSPLVYAIEHGYTGVFICICRKINLTTYIYHRYVNLLIRKCIECRRHDIFKYIIDNMYELTGQTASVDDSETHLVCQNT